MKATILKFGYYYLFRKYQELTDTYEMNTKYILKNKNKTNKKEK